MKTVYSPFVKRYHSQARCLARRRSVFYTQIPGFTYFRVGNLAIWRDGWRVGVSWKGTV